MLYIDRTASRFINVCDPMTEAHWAFQADAKGWCAGEVAEHVTKANRGILTMLNGVLLRNPVTGSYIEISDDEIPYLFYRGEEPPNSFSPSGDWVNRGNLMAAFVESVNNLKDWVNGTTIDLRQYGVKHPVFGLLDGVQWVLFAGAHIERHRAQIIGLRQKVQETYSQPYD